MRKKLSFSLGQYMTTFQAEMYATKACAVENFDRGHRNRNICRVSQKERSTFWEVTVSIILSKKVPNVQYAPKYTVLKLAHLERTCAFVDGA
jgi:hypothetical protein